MGRSGSTLLSAILDRAPGVWSLSEPGGFDALSDIGRLAPDAATAWTKIVGTLSFHPPAARAASVFAVKFRGHAFHFTRTLRRAFPAALFVFNYREGVAWADSRYRTAQKIGRSPDAVMANAAPFWDRMAGGAPIAAAAPVADLPGPAHYEEMMAALWALHLDGYDALRAEGVRFLGLRYEDLVADRKGTTLRLLRYCGLPDSALPLALKAFEKDSQSGTGLARDRAAVPMDALQRARFRAALARHPRFKDPDARVADDA